jgi:hypothetical protein
VCIYIYICITCVLRYPLVSYRSSLQNGEVQDIWSTKRLGPSPKKSSHEQLSEWFLTKWHSVRAIVGGLRSGSKTSFNHLSHDFVPGIPTLYWGHLRTENCWCAKGLPTPKFMTTKWPGFGVWHGAAGLFFRVQNLVSQQQFTRLEAIPLQNQAAHHSENLKPKSLQNAPGGVRNDRLFKACKLQ